MQKTKNTIEKNAVSRFTNRQSTKSNMESNTILYPWNDHHKSYKKKLSNPSVIEPQTQNNENNRKGRSEAPNPKRAEEKDRRMNEIKRDPTPLPGVSRSQGALRRNYSLEDSPYSR